VGRKLTLAALLLGGSVLLSRVLGFVRDAVIAHMLGAGAETDAFYAAFTLPDLMNYFLTGGTLSITFIPLYARLRSEGEPGAADRLASVVLTTVGALLITAIAIGEIFTPTLITPLFPGFDADAIARTAALTRIVLPAQLCFFAGGVLMAVLMAHEKFRVVALVPLIYNASIILFGVLLEPSMGIAGFSVGALVGAFVGALALPAWHCRGLLKLRPRFSFRDPGFVRYIKLSLPLMVGVTLLTADEWIGRWFGSGMDEGTITWLNNARRLMLVPMALIGQAAGQAALPFLSRLASEQREQELGETLTNTIRATLFLSVIAAAFVMVMAEPLVAAIYQRGLFTADDTARTAAILLLFGPAIVAWAGQVIAVRGFYARTDTLRPMLIGTVVTLAVLPVYALLADQLSAPGLAAATSVGVALNLIATIAVYQRRYGGVDVAALVSSTVKGALIAVLAGVAVYAVQAYIAGWLTGLGQLAPWIALALCGGLYGLAVLLVAPRFGGVEAQAIARVRRKLRM